MTDRQLAILKDVPATMRDGTVLRADVYCADGADRLPTLVTRTPYDKSQPAMVPIFQGLARAGYAVVVQDIRGRWASDGECRTSAIMGHIWEVENPRV